MNAVVTTNEKQLPEPVSDAAAMIQAIERAAVNPAVDVEKLERLFALQERMLARNSEAQFNIAMTAAQSDMGRISADAYNPSTKSKYASYGKLDSVLRPIYTKHGFSLSFNEGISSKPLYVMVLCIVSHTAGHSRTYQKEMPADGKGAKGGDVMTLTHASGNAMSYGMRYLLKGIFNVAIGEDDNDGNAPSDLITQSQAADLHALAEEVGADPQRFLKYMGVARCADIKASDFQKAVNALRQKGRQS